MKVKGKCPRGHIIIVETNNPEQWYKLSPVKTWCDSCRSLVGVMFAPDIDTIQNDWAEKFLKGR